MAEAVSIGERIERELVRRMAVALPARLMLEEAAGRMDAADRSAAEVARWDADENGDRAVGLFSPELVPVEAEESDEGGQGGSGWTDNVQRMAWRVRWQKRNGGDTAQTLHRRWAAWLETVAVVEDQLREGGLGPTLVTEIEKIGAVLVEPGDGESEFETALLLEVRFTTGRGDPYVGPGVGMLEE